MTDESMEDEHSAPTDDLVARAGAEDAEAFNQLYSRIAPALLAWAEIRIHSRLKRVIDAEDIMQEVWVRAMDRYRKESEPPVKSFRPWLFGIAQFVVMEALRRSRSHVADAAQPGTPMTDLDRIPASVTSLSRELKQDDAYRIFLQHVEDLSEEERQLLIYRGLEGQDHAEVARRMGIDHAAARKRWGRLRERLRALKLPEHLLETE